MEIESTEWLESERFTSNVPILTCEDARVAAEEASGPIDGPQTVLMWPDES